MPELHRPSGRRAFGFALAASTMLLWGLLPLGLELALRGLDAATITFVRFLTAALALGLWLGARRRLPALTRLPRSGRLLLGVATLFLAVNYQQIMWVIYGGCALLFAPLATPTALLAFEPVEAAALAFCAANTLLAYGAFSEALAHWEATRVSAVLAATPLATLAFVTLGSRLAPQIVPPEPLSLVSGVGAALVVAGSLTTSLGAERAREPVTAPGVPVETSAPLGPAAGPTAGDESP